MTKTVRALGAVTVAYSVAVVAVPELLAKPCRMTVAGETPRPARLLVRGTGVRDTAIGLAMMTAPPGVALWATVNAIALAREDRSVVARSTGASSALLPGRSR
jgi:hypothetical protein